MKDVGYKKNKASHCQLLRDFVCMCVCGVYVCEVSEELLGCHFPACLVCVFVCMCVCVRACMCVC